VKTGHSLIKAKMAETKSPLAGEMSGHIFFADKWYGFDDALYCGLRLVAQVSRSGGTLAALRDTFRARCRPRGAGSRSTRPGNSRSSTR